MPRDATVFHFCLFDATFQPTVGEGVAFVELKVALISEEAATVLWCYVLDPIRCHNRGGEINKVLPPWLKWNALVKHHGELSWLADEQLEGDVLLGKAAQGHRVRVEVQAESQSVTGSLLRLHLFCTGTSLHFFHQVLVF